MEAVLIIGTLIQVVGAISAGNAEADALERQGEQFVKQAGIYSKQIVLDASENERRIAVEKAATAQEALQRTEKLQRIMGQTVAQGAAAGISTQYGSITNLNEESSYQSGLEEAVARDNSNNRIVSLNLNAAINEQNLAGKAQFSIFEAKQAFKAAPQARFAGYVRAASAVTGYASGQAARGGGGGDISSGSTFNPATSPPPRKPTRLG